MFHSQNSYKNYYSQDKKNSYINSKNSKPQSPRNNFTTQSSALKQYALKKKSNSDLNININKLAFRPKINTSSYQGIKTKKFRSYTQKSEMQYQKSKQIGQNLQRYKLKKIQQKAKDLLRNQKDRQYQHFPQSPSQRLVSRQQSYKQIFSARKVSEKPLSQSYKGQYPQTQRNTNLQIDITNLNQIFPNKKFQSNIPQTTKSIMHYNKTAKRNQMALNLKTLEENKTLFKKQKQAQKPSQLKQQKYKLQSNNFHKNEGTSKITMKKQKSFTQNARYLIRKQPEILSIKDFYIYRQLGKGQNGKIYSAFHKKTGFIIALKHFQNSKIIIDYLIDQMKIQLFCKHPNILPAYGYIIEKATEFFISEHDYRNRINSSRDKKQQEYTRPFYNIYIIMEKGDYNLFSLVKKAGKLTEEQTAVYTQQILLGLKYLHDNNIIHRDLKPQNIILCNGVCKITDFGWSVIGSQERQTFCGTLQYVSPEVAVGSRYDKKIDIWSVGILIFQMLTGEAPYDTQNILQNPKQQYRKRILGRLPANTSYECKQIMSKMLKIDPKIRITVEQALNHRWIKENLLRKTVRKDISIISQEFQKIMKRK